MHFTFTSLLIRSLSSSRPRLRHISLRFLTTPSQTQTPSIYYDGPHPVLSLPLPNATTTAFRIHPQKPISLLLEQIREEDPSISSIAVYDHSPMRIRWARSTATSYILSQALKNGGLVLEVNGKRVLVRTPTVEERVQPIRTELEDVEQQIKPLEATKQILDKRAQKNGVRIAWAGLGALCAQWGLMARLTWWEYSWDVMEPISYFLGAGTGILGYMFYVVTSKEYTYEALAEVTVTKHQVRSYKKAKFDLGQYVELKRREEELRRTIEGIRKEYEGVEALVDVPVASVEKVEIARTEKLVGV